MFSLGKIRKILFSLAFTNYTDKIDCMNTFPIFMNLHEKRVIIFGNGPLISRTVSELHDAGARIIVICKNPPPAFVSHCQKNGVELILSSYAPEFLNQAVLAVAATFNKETNLKILTDCRTHEIPCYSVDHPHESDFLLPAAMKRGKLQIAVSAFGSAAYASKITRKLEGMFDESHSLFLDELNNARNHLIKDIPNPMDRKSIIAHLAGDESFDYFIKKGPDAWRDRAVELFRHKIRQTGFQISETPQPSQNPLDE